MSMEYLGLDDTVADRLALPEDTLEYLLPAEEYLPIYVGIVALGPSINTEWDIVRVGDKSLTVLKVSQRSDNEIANDPSLILPLCEAEKIVIKAINQQAKLQRYKAKSLSQRLLDKAKVWD
jgi:hypothetical protein